MKKIYFKKGITVMMSFMMMIPLLNNVWAIEMSNPNANHEIVAVVDAEYEEKTEFDIELTEVGPNKTRVIQLVHQIAGVSLKEAKEIVNGAPRIFMEGIYGETADAIQAMFEEAGAEVTLK